MDRPAETPLEALVRRQIHAHGPLPFKDFMELVLYHYEYGYYAKLKNHPGRSGDFLTSVAVGSCFGELLAVALHQRWQAKGCPHGFTVVEQGANHGHLAGDILDALSANFPAFYSELTYVALDIASSLVNDPRLRGHGDRFEVRENLSSFHEPFRGVFLCNELVDAFPVHRVKWMGDAKGWGEILVKERAGELDYENGALTDERLHAVLSDIDTEYLEPGYVTEVNLAARDWLGELRRVMGEGEVLIIDYGLTSESYFHPSRREGTLQCYRGHQRGGDPLRYMGEQDLTAHVNFTLLEKWAVEAGFAVVALTDHHRFFTPLAKERLLAMERGVAASGACALDAKWLRQFQQLTHPEAMGRAFHVMELTSGATIG